MSASTNPELLAAAFLRMVRGLFGTVAEQTKWLTDLQRQALIGSASGIADVLANLQDYTASGVSHESSSTQWLREFSASQIAQLCESALQSIEAATAGAPTDSVQHASFSTAYSRLG